MRVFYDYGFGDKGLGCYLWIGEKVVGFIPDLEAQKEYKKIKARRDNFKIKNSK